MQGATHCVDVAIPVGRPKVRVIDATAIQRKAQMKAAIVESEHTAFVVDDEYRTMPPVRDQTPLRFQLLEAARTHEIRGWRVHEQSSPAIVAELLLPLPLLI